jgi:hypothetical protein
MTAQEDSESPLDRLTEVHDDDGDGGRESAARVAVAAAGALVVAASLASALVAGNALLAALLSAVTVLFTAGVATGAISRQ